jgi:hypothetical protein
MRHLGKNRHSDDIATFSDFKDYVDAEIKEIMTIIEGLGGGQFLPITGGELTGDLWLHTNKGDYGSRLIFGDRSASVPYTYIGEDADDILTIKARSGIKLNVDDGDIVLSSLNSITLSGDYNIGISAYNNLTLRGTASAELKTSGVLTLFGDSGISILTETSKQDAVLDITMGGNIIPLFNYRYTIGAKDLYYKEIYANSFYSGASANNLNLCGGVTSGYGIRFRLSNYASSPAMTELGNWTSTALTVNTQLKIGEITLKDGGNGKLLVNGVAIN